MDLSSGHLVPNLADSPSSIYEGDSSFNKHVAQASEAAQQAAIAHTPGAASSIDSSLNDVHTLLQPSSSLLGSENFRFSPGNGKHRLPSLEPLPSALVLSVLRRIKGAYLAHPQVAVSQDRLLSFGRKLTNISIRLHGE